MTTFRTISTLAALASAVLPVTASARLVEFFADNNCRGRAAFSYRDSFITEGCKWSQARCRNDVARSVRIHGGDSRANISVYDDPDGAQSDDWATIEVAPTASVVCVPSFQRNVRGSRVVQAYRRHNGLDGKVSHVSIGHHPVRRSR